MAQEGTYNGDPVFFVNYKLRCSKESWE